ncbi:hypothetical protein BCD48_43360 [Pseudofrankia sp. BMG5.36]|nr:hypothetical protein BCD48_43360 [Pseudofrankia sp. BMG5.36]
MAAGHRLHGQSFQVTARSETKDDVIVELATGGWARVHLTWQHPDTPPWPATTVYDSLGSLDEDLRAAD